MARNGIKNTKMLLVYTPFSMDGVAVRRCMSKFAGINNDRRKTKAEGFTNAPAADGRLTENLPSYWVPHPRSGIYFPKGHEWVVDDIPNDAASFDQTFWLRNADEEIDHKSHLHDFAIPNPI